MNLIILCGMFVWCIFWINLCVSTVSNALDMSSAITIVLSGGAVLLKPFVMILFSECRAVVVE